MADDQNNWDPFDDDADGMGGFREIPPEQRPDLLHDGAPVPTHGQVVMPAVLALPGSIGPQLRGAEMISPLASDEEIWRGRNYPAIDPKTQSHNRLYVNEETGEIKVDRNGISRIDTLVLNDDQPIDARPGLTNLTMQAFDEMDRVWAVDLQMPERRRTAIAQEIADIAQRGGMVILQPELFERQSAEMDGFIAVDPKAISTVAIRPDEESGWVLELKRGKGDGVLLEYSTAAKAVDAMIYTVGELGREVDYTTVTAQDADGNDLHHSMLTTSDAAKVQPGWFGEEQEWLEIAVMLRDPAPAARATQTTAVAALSDGQAGAPANDRLPAEVAGVGLNPRWLGSMARLDRNISAISRLAEVTLYPQGRGEPHRFDQTGAKGPDTATERPDFRR